MKKRNPRPIPAAQFKERHPFMVYECCNMRVRFRAMFSNLECACRTAYNAQIKSNSDIDESITAWVEGPDSQTVSGKADLWAVIDAADQVAKREAEKVRAMR
jgi:hypothetical protein